MRQNEAMLLVFLRDLFLDHGYWYFLRVKIKHHTAVDQRYYDAVL